MDVIIYIIISLVIFFALCAAEPFVIKWSEYADEMDKFGAMMAYAASAAMWPLTMIVASFLAACVIPMYGGWKLKEWVSRKREASK